jgi:chromosomal replication initiation ATPase DnaA
LKRQRQANKGLITSTGKMNYPLLQEYDKLKTENDECIKDNEYLKTIIKDFTQEVVKLKAILTEIKEIAERCGKRIPLFEIDEIAEDLQQILQKISECEVK